MVHEVASPDAFFLELAAALKTKGVVFFAEPSSHVGQAAFEHEIDAARDAGFVIADRPNVRGSHAAVLRKV
jgi:hypothetical protein